MATLEMKRNAILSDCGLYRFQLERWWGIGPRVLFIGLNPSTADAMVDDPTVLVWAYFAKLWGYAGYIAVNLYPYRSSSPAALRAWLEDAKAHELQAAMRENTKFIRAAAKSCRTVIACWGVNAPDAAVRTLCHDVLSGVPLRCFGTTKSGAPKHPLARGRHRVPRDQQPVLWA